MERRRSAPSLFPQPSERDAHGRQRPKTCPILVRFFSHFIFSYLFPPLSLSCSLWKELRTTWKRKSPGISLSLSFIYFFLSFSRMLRSHLLSFHSLLSVMLMADKDPKRVRFWFVFSLTLSSSLSLVSLFFHLIDSFLFSSLRNNGRLLTKSGQQLKKQVNVSTFCYSLFISIYILFLWLRVIF